MKRFVLFEKLLMPLIVTACVLWMLGLVGFVAAGPTPDEPVPTPSVPSGTQSSGIVPEGELVVLLDFVMDVCQVTVL
ncbi:MAG: hypothetical protein V2A71_09950 [Candidatus Eisenbacteria bacterium]